MLGNWVKVREDLNGNGTYADPSETEGRLHNMANEITGRDEVPIGSPPTAERPFAYDDAGNLTSASRSSSLADEYTHDCWNRLVKHVEDTGTERVNATYTYNGLHWRIDKSVPTNGSVLGQKRTMWYDASWRLLQEDVDENYQSSSGVNRIASEVWGIRYIDDPVLRKQYDPSSEDADPALHYHLTDVQFSTVAMVGSGSTPALFERIGYRAYGEATHRFPGDFDDDGDCDSTDQSALSTLASGPTPITNSSYDVSMDLNRDGTINSSDQTIFGYWQNRTPLAAGQISDAGTSSLGLGPDNVFGFDGYVFNRENRTYTVRYRWYEPVHGRWMERDPEGVPPVVGS